MKEFMLQEQRVDMAIIGAMDEEVAALLSLLDGYERYEHIHSNYFLGTIQKKSVIVFQSGIGKVNAALAAAFVLERFHPKYMINIGSAGGLNAQLSIGDVVSSAALYNDVDVTLLGVAYGQLPDMPLMFAANQQLISLTQQAVLEVTDLSSFVGVIASGDSFVSNPAQVDLLLERFPDTLAVDMEAAAIAHTCHLYETPYVVIRAISDVVTQPENQVDFFSFLPKAAAHSAKVVARLAALLKE